MSATSTVPTFVELMEKADSAKLEPRTEVWGDIRNKHEHEAVKRLLTWARAGGAQRIGAIASRLGDLAIFDEDIYLMDAARRDLAILDGKTKEAQP